MGCDIHMVFERKTAVGYEEVLPPQTFDHRNYNWFGVLAGVCRTPTWGPPIAADRGIPADSTMVWMNAREEGMCEHSRSWVSLEELQAYDWQRRLVDGRTVAEACGLGDELFEALWCWHECGVDRIIFWFDN